MPPKLPSPAPDDMAPSDHDNAAANGGATTRGKSSSRSAERRRKEKAPSGAANTGTEPTDNTEPSEDEAKVEVVEQRGDETSSSTAAAITHSVASEEQADYQPVAKQKKGFVRRLLGLLALTVVVGGMAGAAYLIWPTVNARYIQPVENTAADLSTVQGQLGDFDARLNRLESETVDLDTSVAGNEVRLDSADAAQVLVAARLSELEGLVDQQTLRIDNLDELASTLGSDLEDANSSAALQIQVTRAAERMSRARLFLYQANYGLAATDLLGARETLAAINAAADSDYSEVISRLDRAITNLPEFPVSAAGDLDIAWETLLATREGKEPFEGSDVESTDEPSVEAGAEPSDR